MDSEILDFFYKYKKEVVLIVITAICTFTFTKVIPTVFALAKELGLFLFALATGRRKVFKFERQYLDWLINEHKYLVMVPSQILNPDRLPRQPELEDVYIQLHLRHTYEKSIDLPTTKLVERGAKTIVLGDPGSGKTTLLRYLCVTYAKLARTPVFFYQRRKSLKARFHSGRTYIPILIYLNRLSQGNGSILESMGKMLPASLSSICPEGYFQNLLESGRAIILLDGLDEIPSQADRSRVVQDIGSLSNASHRNNIWVVSSRVVGYKAQLHQSFATAVVQQLTLTQVQKFIEDWYQRKFLSSGFAPAEQEYQRQLHAQRAKSLIDTLKINPGLASLATNPMLVSLIALLHSVRLELPENRSLLYRDCVELLADRWDLTRGIRFESEVPVELPQKMTILTGIAWHMHDNRLKEMKRVELESIIASQLEQFSTSKQQTPASEVLANLEERSGLLVKRGIDEAGESLMAFSHLSFQEYLAATSLRSRTGADAEKLLSTVSSDPWWREPILIYVAQLESPAAVITRIYENSFRERPVDNLLIAASCLCEVKEDKESDLYKVVFKEVALLYSSGEFTEHNTEPLRFDKHNVLLRHMTNFLLNSTRLRMLGSEIMLTLSRSNNLSEKLVDNFIRELNSVDEIQEFDLKLILLIFDSLNLPLLQLLPSVFKYSGPIDRYLKSRRFAKVDMEDFASVVAGVGDLYKVINKVGPLAAYVDLKDKPLDLIIAGRHDWRQNCVHRLIYGYKLLSSSINHPENVSDWNEWGDEPETDSNNPTHTISEFLKSLVQEDYSKAAIIYRRLSGWVLPTQPDVELLVNNYRVTKSLLAKCFYILLICRFRHLDETTSGILKEFILQRINIRENLTVLIKGKRNDYNAYRAEALSQILALRALYALGRCSQVSYDADFLMNCYISRLPEVVDFAITETGRMDELNSESTQRCLEYLNSQDEHRVGAALLTLSAAKDGSAEIVKRVIPFCLDKDRVFHGKKLSDLAAHSILSILSH